MFDTMNLKEMEKYTGRQEIPEDFDAFWKQEIQDLPEFLDYTLKKISFLSDFVSPYELSFKGTNQGDVYAKCIFPKADEKVPVIFYFHGYQGVSPDWTQCLNYVAAGFAVICLDVRGQAGKSNDFGAYKGITVKGQVIRGMEDSPKNLFYKEIYLDVYQCIEIVSKLEWVDTEKLYTYGASQGGALSLIGAAIHSKIAGCVSIYPFLSDFKRILELGDQAEPYNELFRYFKYKDPFHDTEKKILKNLSYIDVKNFAHLIRCPVKMITGLQDEVCPPSTQFAIYNRIESEKDIYLLPEYGHEPMNVAVNDRVFTWIYSWLKN